MRPHELYRDTTQFLHGNTIQALRIYSLPKVSIDVSSGGCKHYCVDPVWVQGRAR